MGSCDQLAGLIQNGVRADIAEMRMLEYVCLRRCDEREDFIAAHVRLSETEPWAWDVLMKLCLHARRGEIFPPQPLVQFSLEVTLGQRRDPRTRPGRTPVDHGIKSMQKIVVDMLVEEHGYKVTAAREQVGKWANKSLDGIRRRTDKGSNSP